MIKEAIKKLVVEEDLTASETEGSMKEIMSGEATPAQIGSFVTALRMKGETIEEISSCARIMREFATRISPKVEGGLLDIVGTGADAIKTFNVSTASMFVAAAAGISVAKHGNRSVTSKCGSADVLEALGVNLRTEPKEVERIIEKTGVGFMFAPMFHGAMKHAIGPRKEIGIRTVFNILGPLTNPAYAQNYVLGVFSPELTEIMAEVLNKLGARRAMVVHGSDGLDELSIIGNTKISELKDGSVNTYFIKPEDQGIMKTSKENILAGDTPEENARMLVSVLSGKETGPRSDMIALNAGAGIYVSGRADSLKAGVSAAKEILQSGRALVKLKEFVDATGGEYKL